MRQSLKTIVVAIALLGAASSAAPAMQAPTVPGALPIANSLTETASFRRAHWREAPPCRRGGRYYTYGAGWGCDYYLYGLWPARPPRRW